MPSIEVEDLGRIISLRHEADLVSRQLQETALPRTVHTSLVSESLPIPSALNVLIEAHVWPTAESADAQTLTPLATPEDVDRLAPGERTIYLDPPPFATLASEVATNPEFWDEHGALTELDPELALVIGGFGPGSDAAIVLDYRRTPSDPSVMRLAWDGTGNHWVQAASTFGDFARLLRLA